MIIENQDIEEKKLLKMLRVMRAESNREFRGLELVRIYVIPSIVCCKARNEFL